MLVGTYTHSLDAKGRIILPSKLREVIGDSFYITKGFDECLLIYSNEAYSAFAQKIMALPNSDPDARRVKQEFLGNAQSCDADKQGRFIVPQFLRTMADITKDTVIIGNGDHVQVWDVEKLDEYRNGPASRTIDESTRSLNEKGFYF